MVLYQQPLIIIMNKTPNSRYSPKHQFSTSPITPIKTSFKPINHSQAIDFLTNKQSHISMLKRRISALCIKQDKIIHKTINNDLSWDKRYKLKEESLEIKLLLEKQRRKDAERLQGLKKRNLQTRVDKYYRTKNFKQNQLQNKKKSINALRDKSKERQQAIIRHKAQQIQQNQTKKLQINHSHQIGKNKLHKFTQNRQHSIQQQQKRQIQHLLNLGTIKDTQLQQLSQLQLLMIQKNTTSRLAYDASLERLSRLSMRTRSTNNYYQNKEIKGKKSMGVNQSYMK